MSVGRAQSAAAARELLGRVRSRRPGAGGQRGGPRPYRRKLTPEQVADVMARRAAGEKLRTLAKEHGVHPSTISNVVRRGW